MLIRPPTSADVEAMTRIELDARTAAEHRWSPPPSGLRVHDPATVAADWRGRIDGGTVRVAIVDTRVVGCIGWAPDPDGPPTAYGPFVDPLHERVGVGRALLAVAMRRARIAGAERMAIWIAAADPRARVFARAMGFVRDGGHRAAAGNPAGERRRVAILPAGLAPGAPRSTPER